MLLQNPIADGCYADPEARFYKGQYWIYVTQSLDFPDQKNLSAFSSPDLVHWEKHENIVDMSGFPWTWGAVWAPTVIDQDGKYYLIFATNDIQSNEEPGGLELAVADNPAGPFRAVFDHSFVGQIINGAQPIDAHLFRDEDGKVYLYFGGWGHCNVAQMNAALDGFIAFPDGELFHEITPKGYMEGPCMLKKDGVYYFMWSTGDWGTEGYGVMYTVASSPIGPFPDGTMILSAQAPIANGPGHHGYLKDKNSDAYYIVYHRRPFGNNQPNNRHICIERMTVGNGVIEPIIMTEEWEL